MNNFAIIGLGAIVMGGAVLAIAMYFWREGRDLRSDSVEARAILLKKYRVPGDRYMLGLENCFVSAAFDDQAGMRWTVNIRVPSQQWHLLHEGATEPVIYLPGNPNRARVISKLGNVLVSGIMLFAMTVGGGMALFGLFFLFTAATGGGSSTNTRSVAEPPPTKFDKTGVDQVAMWVSPRHDRVAIIDESGRNLRIRALPSGQMLASTLGQKGRILGWRPDGERIAVGQEDSNTVLDAATLQPVSEPYSWVPGALAPSLCPGGGAPVWSPVGQQAAIPCGNEVLLFPSNQKLAGHRDRVLGIAWSASGQRLASVSDDNYVRAWDVQKQRCIAFSEDLPYPRTIYFSDENTIVVIDAALRTYTMRI